MNSSTHENIKYATDIDIIYKVMQSPPSYTANHWHNSLEISYILEGEDSVRVNQSGDSCPQAALPSSTLGKFIPFPVKYGAALCLYKFLTVI